ncbi:hypothetical protein RhiirA4_464584 [Rhizophagus irregularis]|uniref:Uncharacterized protein n=1 Tax=Rhizophagus irregularis TaxID=588596 RepID=A0A2I1GQF2_9GLOM|nr:hypothetical protein RhiirA4_464584 [Rhizophagus irregularis]
MLTVITNTFVISPPIILQFDNRKKFCADIIKELVNLWPSVKIINERSHYSQSQGLVERGNVVLSINNSICRLHKKTPYEFVYGDKPHKNYSDKNLDNNFNFSENILGK